MTSCSKESARIRGMFAGISRRYDLLNHLLSLNIDRLWRRRTARELRLVPGDRALDVCTGTADLALELARHVDADAGGCVVGADFTPEMVAIGERKRRRRGEDRVRLLVGDTLALPFPDASFDVATVAFGIRNVCDLDAGLAEMARVLVPGGRVAILEFTTPRLPVFRKIYRLYFQRVLPRIGRWLSRPSGAARSSDTSGDEADAYSYLPASVDEFPRPDALSDRLRAAGFESVRYRLLTGGIAALHLGERCAPEGEGG